VPYVDGYLIPVPVKKLPAYRRIAQKAAKIWLEHGALEVRECVGNDLDVKRMVSFPRVLKPKAGETVVFSWIVYRSKSDRNRVNKKVIEDPRIAGMVDPKDMPFDMKRMVFGGFKAMVDVVAGTGAASRAARKK
jgi:uncharacterized protein YbaA (DUF1428 family)